MRCLHLGRHDKKCQSGSLLSVLLDKSCSVEPTARVFAITRTDKGRDEFAHFKMEMGKVTTVRGAHSRDLLAAFEGFARMHQHILHVSVIRLHILSFAVFEIDVDQNNNVAPAKATFA